MSAIIGCAIVCAILFAIFAALVSTTAGWVAVGVWLVVSALGWLGTRAA
jgi:hypothetical protein